MQKVNEEQNSAVPSGTVAKDSLLSAAPSFTPGPWAVADSFYDRGEGDNGPRWDVHTPYKATIADVIKEEDARLIAAAPELYEAVKLALVYTRGQLEHAVVNYPGKPQTTLGDALRNALALAGKPVTSDESGTTTVR